MTFNSMVFLWGFLPVILLLYYFSNNKIKNLFLVIISLVIYAWGAYKTLPILGISILINYIVGMIIGKQSKPIFRKIFLAVGIIFNIGMLAYFKYCNFFIENINNWTGNKIFETSQLILPLGISYFTFSAVSYIFDVYRKDVEVQKNPINLALYILFFPKLIMGPIESYKDFEYYIKNKDISVENLASGIKKFIYGLTKKVIIANSMAVIADIIFESNFANLTLPISWIGTLCYMMQIYFDFSGYSDMAIGLSKMLGINLKENFDLPYTSCSITEFWRRWHISLSSWFKNYLYIPLGGNRKGKFRTYCNLFIVFFTTGLWHGASWNFIAWGLFNGFFMIIERIFLKNLLDKNKFKLLNRIYTLFVILISWVLFRVSNIEQAIIYIKHMFIPNEVAVENMVYLSNVLTLSNIIIFASSILLSGILPSILRKSNKIRNVYEVFFEPLILIVLLLVCIMYIVNGTYNSFIYMNF